MENRADVPLLSSATNLEDFKKSAVWQDMERTLLERIEEARLDLEDADTLGDVKRVQGEILSLRYCLVLPDLFIQELTEGRENGRR